MLWGIYCICMPVRSTTNAIQELAAASYLVISESVRFGSGWPEPGDLFLASSSVLRSPSVLNDWDKQRGHFPRETGRNSWGNALYKPEKRQEKSLSCSERKEDENSSVTLTSTIRIYSQRATNNTPTCFKITWFISLLTYIIHIISFINEQLYIHNRGK